MRRFLPILLLILSLMIDTSVLPHFAAPEFAVPQFLLLTVIVLGLLLGRTRGALYGIIGGLLLDITVGRTLGLYALMYTAFGYQAGFAGRRFQRYIITPVLTPLLCLCAYELVMFVYYYMNSGVMQMPLLRDALIRVPLSVVVTQLMYLLYSKILKPSWSRYAGR